MRRTYPFLDELLKVKKQQVVELFGPWDFADEGRISLLSLRSILLSVVPPPSSIGSAMRPCPVCRTTHVALLSLSIIRVAFEQCTGRPWQTPAVTDELSDRSALSFHDGITLSEVHDVLDYLYHFDDYQQCSDEEPIPQQPPSPSSRHSVCCTTSNDRDAVRIFDSVKEEPSTAIAGTELPSTAAAPPSLPHLCASQVRLMWGSVEQLFQLFSGDSGSLPSLCHVGAQCTTPSAGIVYRPTTSLPRWVWGLHTRFLARGEAHALRRAASTSASGPQSASVLDVSALMALCLEKEA